MANSKKELLVLGATIVISGVIAWIGIIVFGSLKPTIINSSLNPTSFNAKFDANLFKSEGDKLLIKSEGNTSYREEAIAATVQRDYPTAITKWEASLSSQVNDPEVRIYLNNSKIIKDKKNPVTVAVVVPIGGHPTNLNIAKEMLRGVAQVQEEVNNRGGINGVSLKIIIVNDDNNPEIGVQVAQSLVEDKSIIAVIGHNSSDVSLAAAPIYQKAGLVMMSPTSTAKDLSKFGSYIYRTAPSVKVQASLLAEYAKKIEKKKIGICFDSDSKASQSLQEEFQTAVVSNGGTISNVKCDLATSGNERKVVQDLLDTGVDALLLAPKITKIEGATEIARIAENRLQLLSDSTLVTYETLKKGQEKVEGTVLAVPWNIDASDNNSFGKNAFDLWNANVNWRTATSYDAALSIVEAIRRNGGNREGIQQALSSPSFEVKGVAGMIAFQSTGDRLNASILVRIAKGTRSGTGYDFVTQK